MNGLNNKVIVAQLGARMYYAVPIILHKANMLEHFYTDLYLDDNKFNKYILNFLTKICKFNVLKQLKNRLIPIQKNKITAFNAFGLIYWLFRNIYINDKNKRWRIHLDYADKFNELVIKRGFKNASMIYSHNTASLLLFKKAKEIGLKCICEQTSAPKLTELKLLQEEQERWRDWENPIDSNLYNDYYEREKQEWELSDIIVAPSDFVFSEMIKLDVPKEKIIVIPYGINIQQENLNKDKPVYDGRRPLKILFVGYLNLQKGVQYLLKAIEKLKSSKIEVKIIGGTSFNVSILKQYNSMVEFLGFIPRSEVRKYYEWADVFVYPSICEGSATVTYEALLFGLPVITTFNAGSIIRNEIEGFIVPIRDSDSIAHKIEFLAMNPSILNEMSSNARKRIKNFSIDEYGKCLMSVINRIN